MEDNVVDTQKGECLVYKGETLSLYSWDTDLLFETFENVTTSSSCRLSIFSQLYSYTTAKNWYTFICLNHPHLSGTWETSKTESETSTKSLQLIR